MPKAKQAKETKATYVARGTRANGARPPKKRMLTKRALPPKRVLGKYIVTDPAIHHGSAIFIGTRIKVKDVLEAVAQAETWDSIMKARRGQISKEAIAEAVRLSAQALARQVALSALPSDEHDTEIMNRYADQLNEEAMDVLKYQVIP